MKKMSFIIATAIFLIISCSPKLVTNAPSSYTIETNKSFEQIWSDVIDFMTSKGTSIKIIDKASGIIVTDEYSFIGSFTYEDKSGNLRNPNAYVVLSKLIGAFGHLINPDYATCNFNVRVKQLPNGTSVTINLVNLKAAVVLGRDMYGRGSHWKYYSVRSTKVFEKELAEKLK
jgi:hypothetical protein